MCLQGVATWGCPDLRFDTFGKGATRCASSSRLCRRAGVGWGAGRRETWRACSALRWGRGAVLNGVGNEHRRSAHSFPTSRDPRQPKAFHPAKTTSSPSWLSTHSCSHLPTPHFQIPAPTCSTKYTIRQYCRSSMWLYSVPRAWRLAVGRAAVASGSGGRQARCRSRPGRPMLATLYYCIQRATGRPAHLHAR